MKTRFSFISVIIALATSIIILSPVAAESEWYQFTLALDGVDDFASAPDNASLDLGTGVDEDFQISLRFYVPDTTNNSIDTMVWKDGAYGLYIIFSSTAPDRLVIRVNTGPTSYASLVSSIDIPAGWHSITAWFDNEYTSDQDLIAVQLDGAPETTGTGFDVSGLPNSTSPLYVGGYGTINPASGWIEELKITADESDVRAWWHFDEDWEDTVFLDSSLYGNTLTGENGAQIGNPTEFPPLPGDFNKISPISAPFVDNIPLNVTLSWEESLYAFDDYEYCVDTSNNDVCDTSWVSTTETQASPSGLDTDTVYYWQVRAKNSAGDWYADSGSWWAFHTVPLPPSDFGKYLPASGSVNQPINDLQLIWHNSSGSDRYEYCFDTEDDDICQAEWISTLSAPYVYLDNLAYDTTYYYQVKAVNNGGETFADGGEWWSFTTLPETPAAFGKSSPISGAIDQPGIVPLSWESSTRATGYEYCWNENYTENTTDCIHGWISVGANTTADFNVGIGYWPTTYYWQVRALNAGGVAYANSGDWWSFTTLPPAPRDLYKESPTDGSTNQPKSLTLSWFDGVLVDEYEYCYDTTPGTTCEGTWTSTGTDTSAVISDLLPATTYYWQMRATNSGGTTYANGGSWWSFTTIAIPGSFDKVEPLNGATGIAKNVNFYWYTNSTNALTYEYCYDTSINNNCDTSWVTDNNLTNYITGLDPSTTYNWQVRAGNSMGYTYANGGTWWSFTTGTSPASFSKTAPSDGVTNQPWDLVISWVASAGTDYYEYCYDTSDDDACNPWLTASWHNKALSGLDPYTTYYWQVRAVNSFGTVYADASSLDFWSFATGGVPGAFDRTSPSDDAEEVSINPTLAWTSSSNMVWYDYCMDTSDDNDCTNWVNNYGNTSVQVNGLEPGTTYFWHVKAKNDFGTTYAGDSAITFWSFTTDPKPAAFNKTGPANSASEQPLNLDLDWESSVGASYYEYCYGTTNPCSNWMDNGSATSHTLEGLSENTTYYWNVRAVNDHGTTYSNGTEAAFWSFSTGALPESFTKWMPDDGGMNYSPDYVNLVWQPNSHQDDYGFSYEYCYDTIYNADCDTVWVSTHTNSGGLTDLIPATYYWQVRANNLIGSTYANNGTWWSFTVPPNPGDFSKTSPTNGATNLQATISLSWTSSSDVFEYEYCYDAVENNECDASWLSADTNTSVEISSLSPNTTYYWQLRSSNASGTTYANEGTWWSFSTEPVPEAFSKTSPVNKATNRPPNLKLSWGSSDSAEEYQYCLKLSDGTCTWTSTGTNTNVAITGLVPGLYKWQVRAINPAGITSANDGTWWSFTVPPKPGAFNKTSPLSGVNNKPTTLTLYWQASTNAVSYQYCVKLKLSDTCTWKSTGLIRKVTITSLLKNTGYFWQVRARNATGITTANNGTWWNFTTVK